MKNVLRFLGLLSAGLLLVAVGNVQAAEEMADSTVNMRVSIGLGALPQVRVHDAPLIYRLERNETSSVPLPQPIGDDPGGLSSAGMPVTRGPEATNGAPTLDVGAVATGFISPRGSAMSSPKQQADRAISRLIRNLH